VHDALSGLDDVLTTARLVDLTQPLGPATILWPGSRPFEAETTVDHDTHGAYARDLALPEHAGTHVDAPAHFARNGITVDRIPLAALVRPAVRLDVRAFVGDDESHAVSAGEIEEIESREGEIPSGAAVLMHTGWDRFLDDPARYGGDGPAFPGLAADAARLLVRRGVTGIGIDTLGVDPGGSLTFSAHRITMPAGVWHAEGLVGLERVPPRGAWLVVGAIPVVSGSGAPARVFAIVP
jgi:kynurenine formamidase